MKKKLIRSLHVRAASHGHESMTDESLKDFTVPAGTDYEDVGMSKVPGHKVIRVHLYIRVSEYE